MIDENQLNLVIDWLNNQMGVNWVNIIMIDLIINLLNNWPI